MVVRSVEEVGDLPPHGTMRDQSCLSARKTIAGYPRLVEVKAADCGRCTFEIAPGIFMQSMMETGISRSETIGRAAISAVEALQLPRWIFDAMEALNVNLRRLVAAARSRGLPCRAHRVDLAAREQWIKPEEPLYIAGFETMGANLRAKQEWLLVRSHVHLEQQFSACLADLRDRHEVRARLHSIGADGSIDGLALKSLLADPHDGSAFDRLRRHDRVRVAGGVELIWSDGRILSTYVSAADNLEWYDDTLLIHDRHLPETVAIRLIGQSISRIVDLPKMDGAAIIAGLVNQTVQDRPSIIIRLRLPLYFLDLKERRHWQR